MPRIDQSITILSGSPPIIFLCRAPNRKQWVSTNNFSFDLVSDHAANWLVEINEETVHGKLAGQVRFA
ncbi:MAG: hypothetical protein IPP42_05350 [Saprospiraceae bacterium]|nr:hypothetical protein [Saprospiraceae bacterium]